MINQRCVLFQSSGAAGENFVAGVDDMVQKQTTAQEIVSTVRTTETKLYEGSRPPDSKLYEATPENMGPPI